MAKVVSRLQEIVSVLRSSVRLQRSCGSRLSVLAIMSNEPERVVMQAVFRDVGWKLMFKDTAAAAIAYLRKEAVPVILFEREQTDSDWRVVVSQFSKLSPRPCIILLSGSNDKNLWDELIRFGGYDILRTPVSPDTVIRAVRSGWFLWRNQQKLQMAAKQRL